MAQSGPSSRIDRSQIPDEFTPETIRAMGMRVARVLADHRNGILTPAEQAAFDRSLREVLQDPTERLGRSVGRDRRGGPTSVDPTLRRSFQRTQRRLDAQAERARRAFPHLTDDWDVGHRPVVPSDGSTELPEPDDEPLEHGDPAPGPDGAGPDDAGPDDAGPDDLGPDGAGPDEDGAGEDVSIGTFEAEIEQASDTMDLLEQIASIQQQQLEHQRAQLLTDTRGVFFALAVSVAVIIAGVAPLVQASTDERRLILLWTAGVCVVAGAVYALVRAVQSRPD